MGPRLESRRRVATAAAALLTGLLGAPLDADPAEQARVQTGMRLFRALVAADLGLDGKTLDGGKLLVVFLYTDDARRADELARAFAGAGAALAGHPLLVETSADPRFAAYGKRVPAGVFLTQAPGQAQLRDVVQFGIARRVIVYSPFEGHVEKGVLGGLSVEAQVRPYVNLRTLTASQIALKEFFFKATKVYR